MNTELPTTCLAAYLASLPLANIRSEAIAEISQIAADEITEVIEEGELTQAPEIVAEVADRIQLECDEILIRDEDDQVIAKIIDAALTKFAGDSGLYGADGEAGDAIVSLVTEHMEQIARDWCLDAYTSQVVIDDLIEEATSRADAEIDEILARVETEDEDVGDEEVEVGHG